jgi:hypothetical protein
MFGNLLSLASGGRNELNEVALMHIGPGTMFESDCIFWRVPAEFCWRGSFAGATFISKTAPAKFKMRQQNFRCASKILHSLRVAWAGGKFFPVVLLCQFLVLAGNRFWFYILPY